LKPTLPYSVTSFVPWIVMQRQLELQAATAQHGSSAKSELSSTQEPSICMRVLQQQQHSTPAALQEGLQPTIVFCHPAGTTSAAAVLTQP
jgi:hypothetical protein